MPVLNRQNDPLGQALLDHWQKQPTVPILAMSDTVEEQEMPTELFFRSYSEMPELEQLALQNSKGRVLDVGAGAGCHSLWLKDHELDLVSLEISPGAVEVMKAQGLTHVVLADFIDWQTELTFDTILFLMNGIGLAGTLDGLEQLFEAIDRLLAPDGQVICDSSDLKYLYSTSHDAPDLPEDNYYGEINYSMKYRDIEGPNFSWLFVDFETFAAHALASGYHAECLEEGQHFDFLARLTRVSDTL